jgi:hypothetical protein
MEIDAIVTGDIPMMEDLYKISVIILTILFLFVAIPRLRFPDLDHGDEFADANVLTAGKNFVKFGFIKCRFLPHFEQQSDIPQEPYLHYPPLPEIINGALRMVFRTDSLFFFRSIALIFSFFNIIFWYLFIKKLTRSSFIGLFAGLFYITNPYFIFGMDALQRSLIFLSGGIM